jgi:hypothetical protein
MGAYVFFVLYHYKANAILATPAAGLDDKSIFKAYKMQFDNLTSKGYKPKINIMDNQATKHIKVFLTEQQCQLQLVEPHNHRLNAAERATQRPSRMHLLQHSPQQAATFHCNCETKLLPKYKIR